MSSETVIYGKLPKALMARLHKYPDFGTITISADALKRFNADYMAYAKATGFGCFALEWFVDPKSKDLAFRIPGARHGIVVESQGSNRHARPACFNIQRTGRTEYRYVRETEELFAHAHTLVYEFCFGPSVHEDGYVLGNFLDEQPWSVINKALRKCLAPIRADKRACERKRLAILKECSKYDERRAAKARRDIEAKIKRLNSVFK